MISGPVTIKFNVFPAGLQTIRIIKVCIIFTVLCVYILTMSTILHLYSKVRIFLYTENGKGVRYLLSLIEGREVRIMCRILLNLIIGSMIDNWNSEFLKRIIFAH